MVTENRRKNAVIEQLFAEPHRFEVYQAIRLLEQHNYLIRFKSVLSFAYPENNIQRISLTQTDEAAQPRVDLALTTVGFLGAQGVLPDHYTEQAGLQKQNKDEVLTDFIDMLNHRTQMFFYQAWQKNRFYLQYESKASKQTDSLAHILFSLIGHNYRLMKNKLSVPNESLAFYAGLLTQRPRSASALASILKHYLRWPVSIKPFQGIWMILSEFERSKLTSRSQPQGQFCTLGKNSLLGQKIWNVQNKFRVCIGPLSYADAMKCLPHSEHSNTIRDFINYFTGSELQYDIQVIIKANDVPKSQFKKQRLGWNTWLKHREFTSDNCDLILR